jgi:hypothetical protein
MLLVMRQLFKVHYPLHSLGIIYIYQENRIEDPLIEISIRGMA